MKTFVLVILSAIILYIMYYYVIPFIGFSLILRKGFKNKYWSNCRIHNGEIKIEYIKNNEKITLVRQYNVDSVRFIIINMRDELNKAYKTIEQETN